MTTLQKSIYNEALQRSRKTIFDLEAEKAEAEKEKANGSGTKKKTKSSARAKDKLYLENSTNVLMDLRKAASHPMLFRRRFTDDTLTSLANILLKEPDYKQRGARFDYVKEDMEVMTDSELQAFCATYKVRNRRSELDHRLADAPSSLRASSFRPRTATCKPARSKFFWSFLTVTRSRGGECWSSLR